ncbi:MAG: metal-dependent transcriptional regulator, partial [Anaerolineaceae bacterium]
LKHIYELTEKGSPASTNDLARELDIKPASVTGMIQKLAAEKPTLVEYQKHQGVTLTPTGKRAALEVIRHHRLLETWLVQTLGYSWDEVHEEAERLEHVISEDFERRIAAALGNPTRDPHGELIPTADLKMPVDDTTPLSSLRPSQSATIQRVAAADPNLLRHLDSLGLTPGIQIEVTEYSAFDNNLTVKVGRKINVLGLNITTKIFVELIS